MVMAFLGINSMKVKITKTVGWDVALADALWTVHKEPTGKEPSEVWKAKACISEHSMLADVRFVVEIYGIPNWVAQHISRHDAFAGHHLRETKEVHFVATQRTDRTGLDRNKLPQDTPVDHRISLSAKDFVTISRLRLCTCASKETREVWRAILDELAKTEPTLAKLCVKNCVYRGFCPEFTTCGYTATQKFNEEVLTYRNAIGR
jgi:thymidylate synthase ThyX